MLQSYFPTKNNGLSTMTADNLVNTNQPMTIFQCHGHSWTRRTSVVIASAGLTMLAPCTVRPWYQCCGALVPMLWGPATNVVGPHLYLINFFSFWLFWVARVRATSSRSWHGSPDHNYSLHNILCFYRFGRINVCLSSLCHSIFQCFQHRLLYRLFRAAVFNLFMLASHFSPWYSTRAPGTKLTIFDDLQLLRSYMKWWLNRRFEILVHGSRYLTLHICQYITENNCFCDLGTFSSPTENQY